MRTLAAISLILLSACAGEGFSREYRVVVDDGAGGGLAVVQAAADAWHEKAPEVTFRIVPEATAGAYVVRIRVSEEQPRDHVATTDRESDGSFSVRVRGNRFTTPIITHELGHVLGLDHPEDLKLPPCGIMYPLFSGAPDEPRHIEKCDLDQLKRLWP